MSKVYVFEVTQLIEVEADSRDEAIALIPLPHNGFEGQGYFVVEEEIALQSEREGKR
jgi:hypothetical protein